MSDFCVYCRKDITMELPNDWNPKLCFKCAQKEHFAERKLKAGKEQQTIWDRFK
jgi:hypothetical protein